VGSRGKRRRARVTADFDEGGVSRKAGSNTREVSFEVALGPAEKSSESHATTTRLESSTDSDDPEQTSDEESEPSAGRARCSRLLVSAENFVQLSQEAAVFDAPVSKFADSVLEKFLEPMERALFGSKGCSSPVAVPKEARALDAVIFDVEGVLFDSAPFSAAAASETLARIYSVSVPPDKFMEQISRGDAGMLAHAAREAGVQSFDLFLGMREFLRLYMTRFVKLLFPLRGVRGLMSRLKATGLKVGAVALCERMKLLKSLAVVEIELEENEADSGSLPSRSIRSTEMESREKEETRSGAVENNNDDDESSEKSAGGSDSSRELVQASSGESGDDDINDGRVVVDYVGALELVKNVTPVPNVFEVVARQLQVDAGRVAVITSSPGAVAAAKAAGMRAVAVCTLHSESQLLSKGADAVFPMPAHITIEAVYGHPLGAAHSL